MAKKKFDKAWGDRVLGALNVLDKTAEKQQYDATHTVDGKDLKVGLKVFVLEDPSVQWTIMVMEDKIYKRRVALEAKGQESIKRTPYQLFVNQKKAVDASIRDIQQSEKVILRDMRESLSRLDAPDRVKKLNELKKKLK